MSNRKFNLDKYLHGKNHHKRRKNRRNPSNQAFRNGVTGNDTGYIRVDLHDLPLHIAKNRIKEELRDAKVDQEPGVKFIHGFRGGTAIRDWIRNGSLEQFMESANISGKIWVPDEGTTCISLPQN